MFVTKDISSDGIGEDQTILTGVADYPTKLPVFRWPRHSNLVEKMREEPLNISEQTKLTLQEIDLYQEDATTCGMKGKVSEAARVCSRNIKRKVYIKFDIFMGRGRPGLEVEGVGLEEEKVQKKKRKRNRKSKCEKNKDGKTDEKKGSFIEFIKDEGGSYTARTI
jgi:hypothetical protein